MLIHKLQKIRVNLLESIEGLTSQQLNIKPSKDEWSISQILYHLYITEKAKTALILSLREYEENREAAHKSPPAYFLTKHELLRLLWESRSDYLQLLREPLDNEKIDRIGLISMRTMTESIYLHEQRHAAQIREIKRTMLTSTPSIVVN